jgi:ABC-2 type transport system ATP-binding protein
VRLVAPRVPIAWQPRILRQEAGVFQIRLDTYAELESLLGALREEGVPIGELALAETDLEQVFLRIMKNPDAASVSLAAGTESHA